MKKTLLLSLFIASAFSAFSQSPVTWEGRLFIGVCGATIHDNDPRPSGELYQADGHTTSAGSQSSVSVGANAILGINDRWSWSVGLAITTRNLYLHNQDGSYSGHSHYNTGYLQVPVLLRYTSDEIATNTRIHIGLGPSFDLKISERLDGGDGAHYWNLANNRYDIDHDRGRNGDNEPMKLFAPFNVGLFLTAGVDYAITDQYTLYMGILINPSFVNMVNPDLDFDTAKTGGEVIPVRSDVSFTTTLVGLDLGFKF